MTKRKSTLIDTDLYELVDTDFGAKEEFLRKLVDNQGDEYETMAVTSVSPLIYRKWLANDAGFKATVDDTLKNINDAIERHTLAVKEKADAIRQTLKEAGLWGATKEPQIDIYATVSVELSELMRKKSSPYYKPVVNGSANPIERLVQIKRAELQTSLKALGVTPTGSQAGGPVQMTGPSTVVPSEGIDPNDPLGMFRHE